LSDWLSPLTGPIARANVSIPSVTPNLQAVTKLNYKSTFDRMYFFINRENTFLLFFHTNKTLINHIKNT